MPKKKPTPKSPKPKSVQLEKGRQITSLASRNEWVAKNKNKRIPTTV